MNRKSGHGFLERQKDTWYRLLCCGRLLCALTIIMGAAKSSFASDADNNALAANFSVGLIEEVKAASSTDLDFQDQGEYAGTINQAGQCYSIGLQVVALGDGKFDALVYRGGLPGNGYDCSQKMKLSGSREGERVDLRCEKLVVSLQTGYAAVVKDLDGQRLGYLQPIKRLSPTLGAKAPDHAIILFEGKSNDRLKNAKVTEDGLLGVGAETKDLFQNFTMHAEFRTPFMPKARSQERGNSGFYLQRRYEVQVLDSFGLEPQHNDCGALYRLKAPDLNMCFPPLRWQTYDITFNAAKFRGDGFRYCKARISVRHNGVLIHNNVEIANKTGAGRPEGPDPMPILLQNHNNDVHFRNVWIVDDDATCYSPAYCTTQLNCGSCRKLHACRR